jgi:hypothetical protein
MIIKMIWRHNCGFSSMWANKPEFPYKPTYTSQNTTDMHNNYPLALKPNAIIV